MSKARDLADLGAVTNRLDTVGASEGALSHRNLIINGAMQVAQRGTSATVSNGSNEGYSTVDRFFLNFNNAVSGAIDMSQSTDAPDGFSNSVKLQCSTTNTTFTTTMNVGLQQRIEAQNLQQLAYGTSGAKNITLSWYMKAVTFSDPISVNLYTQDGTPEYFSKSFTPTTSWARYTLTFPPSTTATINNDNGQGFILQFVIAGSSSGTYAASADSTAWSTTRSDYRDDIGNFTSSTSNELYITGVQMELGKKATDFEHRSYGDELARCQRYYEVIASGASKEISGGNYFNSGTVHCPLFFETTKRSESYTLEQVSGTNYYRFYRNNGGDLFNSFTNITRKNINKTLIFAQSGVSGTSGHGVECLTANAAAYVAIDDEL